MSEKRDGRREGGGGEEMNVRAFVYVRKDEQLEQMMM